MTLLSSVYVYVCVPGRLGPRVCQDAPSFGNSLSRCSIFRQVTLLSSVCVCVWAFGSLCMSGCSILWQQPVKMFHLSSGDPFVLCVCMCVSGRLGPRVCQDAPSFGNSLSRCSIFRQVTLLSSVCVYVCVSGRLGPRVCQDAPSFGNSLSRCPIFRQVTLLSSVCVCVSGRLGPCVCQDAPSFGNSLSRCSIFRQVTFCPLCVYMCVCLGVWVLVYVRMLHPSATACQDVPSFVR